MRKNLCALLSFPAFLLFTSAAFSQTQTFDIASFIPPPGWQRTEKNGTLSFFDSKTNNGLTAFCQIILYPSSHSTGDAAKDFKTAWNNLVAIPTKSKARPVTQTEKTPDGWTVVTGGAAIQFQGMQYNSIVASLTGFGKTMSVQVNTAGGDYTPIIDQFFKDMNVDNKATAINKPDDKTQTASVANHSFSINDYVFTIPEGWTSQNKGDHILLQNPQSECLIRILAPQPTSSDLEKDAKAVFDMMYAGWNYANTGANQYTFSKGYTAQGLPFFMIEGDMNTTNAAGQYLTETGAAWLIQVKDKIIIVSVRHSALLAHVDCNNKYNTWRRFFNTFALKNRSAVKQEENKNRIVGLWKMTESMAVSDYVFAANGNYEHGGAIGSSTTTSDDRYTYIHNKTYAFEGNGKYSLSGSVLQLKPRSGAAESISIRFDQVNHGGTGWKDRMWLRRNGVGGENEVRYEKQR